MRFIISRRIAAVFVIALFAAACGGGADETTTTTAGSTATTVAASTTTVAASTTVAEESGAVSGLKAVRSAVVRIVGEGSFVDPSEGMVYNAAGSGSGFIIDPSGLAVTNNHVVTGAAFLQVYVDGEDEPRNAKVVGVSECSDLAVIDIDGADFPYLDWDDGDLSAGTKVYAAGFPLGDPEYTLTEGIISKEKADGESSWASVDSVIEHTAQILHGNSGGPLVGEDGRVIGINYAGNEDLDLNYAISRLETERVLDDLIAGKDVNSIGVNGEAFADQDLSGIWVFGVESGSPAANLGITGGDVITKMEGIVLSLDGTMADYCDILRSHNGEDPLSVEILRSETEEVLTGTLNGDEELQLSFSFAEELGNDVAAGDAAYEYVEVYDDVDVLVMQIPTTWTDIDNSGWIDDDGELVGNAIIASPDLTAYYTGWDTPGVFFGASEVLLDRMNPGDLLDPNAFSGECVYDDRYEYEDAVYTGEYDVWLSCGGTDTAFVSLEAYPADESFVVFVQIQVVTDADLDALDTILATFDVDAG
jgi:serine protease Do